MSSSKLRRGLLVLAAALGASVTLGAAAPDVRELPDARTWRFFSEKKIRSRLFFTVPGAADSIFVSQDPACCEEVAPSGRWVAVMSFNRRVIENELLILSRDLARWCPLPGYTAIAYSWSPNGLVLAGYGKRRTASSVCFFAVDPVTRSASLVDSMLTPEDYEFAWDSTSHRVAICRPSGGPKDPARVLLYSTADRKTSTLATLSNGTLSNPRWIAGGVLIVNKESAGAQASSAELRFPLSER